MLEYVSKLTLEPSEMVEDDVERLRGVGFEDTQILEIVQLAAWFNFMTRMADGLGVRVESWRRDWAQELWGREAGRILVEGEGTGTTEKEEGKPGVDAKK